MRAHVTPHPLSGTLRAHASKSVAHRLAILAALTQGTTIIACDATSDDIDATLRCVEALGARVTRRPNALHVNGIPQGAGTAPAGDARPITLDVGESGTTLRLMLPVVCALGRHARIMGHGRLAARPLTPLSDELRAHGCTLSSPDAFPLEAAGRLTGGTFMLPGNVSSQYVSGLLMAAPLLGEDVDVMVSAPVESAPYLRLTGDALARFGVAVLVDEVTWEGARYLRHHVNAASTLTAPPTLAVEGDWSNAAFWLVAGALCTTGVTVTDLNATSAQGDRAIMAASSLFGAALSCAHDHVRATKGTLRGATVDLADTPDLVAPLAALAAHTTGTTTLTGAARLALKESNRLETVCAAIRALGGRATHTTDTIVIDGGHLTGGAVDAAGDHRIAMMAAVAAAYADGPTTILGAECVRKSYPTFFEDFAALGGVVRLEG